MATHVVVGKCLGLLVFSANFRKGTSVLLVKGTAHTGMKETCVKTTMITSASSGVGCLKKYPFPTSFFHMMSFFRPCSEINVWTYIFSMPTLIAQWGWVWRYRARVTIAGADSCLPIITGAGMIIRESVDSLCRDGSGPPIVCVHWKAVLIRERSCSKPFWTPSYPIRTFLYSMIPPK